MSRIRPVVKREFVQSVSSRAFVIGTLLGPLLIVGLFAMQYLVIAKSVGGTQRIAIVDATGRGLGERVERAVRERIASLPPLMSRPTYQIEVQTAQPAEREAVAGRLTARVNAKEIDGFLWIPPDVIETGSLRYEGANATNSQVTGDLRQGVQRVVQSERLRQEGIDPERLSSALQPVTLESVKTGEGGAVGNPRAARALSFGMAFAIYIVIIMYGQSIMSSVQEEKRDRIVELIVSSVRARDLLLGKVMGIGAAGVLQMIVWVAVAAVLLNWGGPIAAALGASDGFVQALSQRAMLPSVPLSVGVVFVLYFAGGFFLFATLFAVVGAIVTNAQEAQQFMFPILVPFLLGLFIAMPAAEDPNTGVAVIGSLVPFTSPMVMPVRATAAGVDWIQLGLSVALLYATAALIIWFAGKIYRTAIFATGKKPTASELLRWMRAA